MSVMTEERPQWKDALARANRIRLRRAERKREIARGELTVVQVLERPLEEMESIPLIELLTSQRRWGKTRARKLLWACGGMAENKKLGSCTPRQRALLASLLKSPSQAGG